MTEIQAAHIGSGAENGSLAMENQSRGNGESPIIKEVVPDSRSGVENQSLGTLEVQVIISSTFKDEVGNAHGLNGTDGDAVHGFFGSTPGLLLQFAFSLVFAGGFGFVCTLVYRPAPQPIKFMLVCGFLYDIMIITMYLMITNACTLTEKRQHLSNCSCTLIMVFCLIMGLLCIGLFFSIQAIGAWRTLRYLLLAISSVLVVIGLSLDMLEIKAVK